MEALHFLSLAWWHYMLDKWVAEGIILLYASFAAFKCNVFQRLYHAYITPTDLACSHIYSYVVDNFDIV